MTQQQRYVQRRQANHTLHIILTICTCGLWAITGWPIAAIMGRKTVTTMPAPPPVQQGYYPTPQTQQQPYPPQYQAPPYYGPQGQQPPPPGPYGPPQQ
ncbi:hypothetical protein ACFWXI_14555 [[Kitasatospora] papulosa]|uniref:hypothetical protein n=1 Tax=[Kitasatospora] papulosa TaxID=1464011 RepID=UPI00368F81F2